MPGEAEGWLRLGAGFAPESSLDHGAGQAETFGDRFVQLSGSKLVWILSPPDSWSRVSSLSLWGRLGKGSVRATQMQREPARDFDFEEAAFGVSGTTLTQSGEFYLIRVGGQRTEEAGRDGRGQWLGLGHLAATWHLGEKTFFIYGGARTLAFGDAIWLPLFGVSHEFGGGTRGTIAFPFAALVTGPLPGGEGSGGESREASGAGTGGTIPAVPHSTRPSWRAFVRASGRRVHLAEVPDVAQEVTPAPQSLLVHRVQAGGGVSFRGVPHAEAVIDAGLDGGRALRLSSGATDVVESGAATGTFVTLQVTYRFGASESDELAPGDARLADERSALEQTLPVE